MMKERDEWRSYWESQGQPWRTEPEIPDERKEFLRKRRDETSVNIKQGIYPFRDPERPEPNLKLSRADVEWLLAMHENGCGPVDWNDESQRKRKGLDLRGTDLSQADLRDLPLAGLRGGLPPEEWTETDTQQPKMAAVLMKGAKLSSAKLQGATLFYAQLQGATLRYAQLQGANLRHAQLQRAQLRHACLQEADLRRVFFDNATSLDEVIMGDGTYVADISWEGVNLAVVNWSSLKILGEEYEAQRKEASNDYQTAVRANRQLAIVLREQGLDDDAARFAYCAKFLQRKVYWHQIWEGQVRQIGAYLFSGFLALLAGYGYRIWRIFAVYGLLIGLFAAIYSILSAGCGPAVTPACPVGHPLIWYEALIVSVTAFHGRTFAEQYAPGTPLAVFAAIEGIFGLVIEGVFIAMLVQRFFGK